MGTSSPTLRSRLISASNSPCTSSLPVSTSSDDSSPSSSRRSPCTSSFTPLGRRPDVLLPPSLHLHRLLIRRRELHAEGGEGGAKRGGRAAEHCGRCG